jgi:dGTPase
MHSFGISIRSWRDLRGLEHRPQPFHQFDYQRRDGDVVTEPANQVVEQKREDHERGRSRFGDAIWYRLAHRLLLAVRAVARIFRGPLLNMNPAFASTVSRRKVDPALLQWWTSDRTGGTLRSSEATEKAIRSWASRRTLEETIETLRTDGMVPGDAAALCKELDIKLGLWSIRGVPSVRVAPEPSSLSAAGSPPFSISRSVGRPYTRQADDGYRGAFQRDRDRVVWSRGLRQLANKTQVFPLTSDDFLRNRMAHSLEVMQLASTIGASFSLNPHVIEAGALAHDIGHTPFGHPGEYALDRLMNDLKCDLGGFNHYEHGVDVVRWLEDAYQSPALGGIHGLNLTSEVAECIFKHTYCQSGRPFSQEELYKRSKHQAYINSSLCHVEGQAVRLADKILYLISDLEDGIRMGVFTTEDLLTCRLLRRPPLDLAPRSDESLYVRFLSQRPLILRLLMEDAIDATDRKLASRKSVEAVRQAKDYTVCFSADLQEEVNEVWKRLQSGKTEVKAGSEDVAVHR